MSPTRWILLALYLASFGQLAWYLPRMPAVMATHYDGAGVPNGFMTPGTALGVQLFVLASLAFGFVLLPAFLSRFGSNLINIPNRQYWTAPDRKAATMVSLRSRLELMGCAALALVIVVSECNFRANLNPPARLALWPLAGALAGFLGFMAAWTVSLYRRFRRPPTAAA
jgi:hypothetical protein